MLGACRVAAALALGAGAVALPPAASPAAAHPTDPGVRTVLDTVKPSIPGVTIAVATSAAPQLVASNSTGTELVVLADTGEPFLRIGPDGVLANLDSPSWHFSNSPGGAVTVPATAGPDAPPRWARVATEPAWGWFDHRLHPEARAVPPGVLEEGERATLARWEVPLEYGGEPVTASGRIEYAPGGGRVSARLVGPAQPLPGVSVQLAPGPVPGLVLRNDGTDTVTVLGPASEPFARIGPDGVEVNRHSPMWVDNARAQERDPAAATAVVDPHAEPDWFVISATPTFAWLEFRGAYPDAEPPRSALRAREPTVLSEWSVPLEAGGRQATVAGETVWAPGERPSTATGSDPGGFLRAPVVAAVIVLVAGIVALVWVGRRIGAVRRSTP